MAFTFFFRDKRTLDAIGSEVVPRLVGRRHLDIWDAGCASGEEPYSVAILLRESMGEFLFRNVRIFASDLNPQFGEVISNGVYAAEQISRIPDAIRRTYFETLNGGDKMRLIGDIRKAVQFQHHDLTTLQPIRAGLALIVCKNVLLHFSPAERVAVLSMFHDALSTDGFLATEATQKLPAEAAGWFVPLHGDFPVYQRV